jgi:hypothetical protein
VLNASLLLTVVTLLFLLVGRLRAADPVLLAAPAYINVGGAAIADVQGNLWLADQPFGASLAYGYVDFSSADSVSVGGPGIAVSGTDNDLVCGSGREGMDAYVVNLPNGTYDLTLHFAEVSGATTGDGQRVFDVFVEGEHVLAGLDIYAAVGPRRRAPSSSPTSRSPTRNSRWCSSRSRARPRSPGSASPRSPSPPS